MVWEQVHLYKVHCERTWILDCSGDQDYDGLGCKSKDIATEPGKVKLWRLNICDAPHQTTQAVLAVHERFINVKTMAQIWSQC